MSHAKTGNGIGPLVKALVVTFFHFLAIVIAFICKMAGLILTKVSEVLEKIYDNGHH